MTCHDILLVEDNIDSVYLTRRALRKCDIADDLEVVHDGVEALDYLFATGAYMGRDRREMPRLVLLDLDLPKLDGFEVLRRLRADERTKLLSVVVLTSSKEESDLLRAHSLGANSYIRKPDDFTEFNEAIRLLGRYWLHFNQPAPQKGS
jgi:two-component system response regulator